MLIAMQKIKEEESIQMIKKSQDGPRKEAYGNNLINDTISNVQEKIFNRGGKGKTTVVSEYQREPSPVEAPKKKGQKKTTPLVQKEEEKQEVAVQEGMMDFQMLMAAQQE